MSVSVFAERLRNAMNSRGLKQVDLVHAAEHRGVKMGKSHISQYVAGKTLTIKGFSTNASAVYTTDR